MLDCMTMFMMLNTDYDPLPPLVVNVYIFDLEMAGNSFCSQFDNQRVRYVDFFLQYKQKPKHSYTGRRKK